jgi:predicted acyltransferase
MTEATTQQPAHNISSRLFSLDVIRGITIAFMIMVNNNGDWRAAYRPLVHSAWNGWTPADLVFPSFLFIVGITTVISTDARRARGESRKVLLLHAFRRAVILFLLGLVINGFPYFSLATLRIYGVLQRIAICYFIAMVLYLWDQRWTWICGVTVVALAGYWILMRWVPIPGYGMPTHNFPLLDRNINWVAYVDRCICPGRLYQGTWDPEGLISDIPALGTSLIGVLTGLWLRSKQSPQRKATGLLSAAVCGLMLGKLWNIWFPINKNLWTSSFVLFAAGSTLLLLAACYWLIEIKHWVRGWTAPWAIFGSNAIIAYVFSELLESALYSIPVQSRGQASTLQALIYERCFSWIADPSFRALLYSLVYVLICFVPVAVLYRKKIFIKL